MSGTDLFAAMSFIDGRFVDEAEHCGLPRPMVSPWLRIASMAACLCVVLLSLWFLRPFQNITPGQVPHTTGPDDPYLPEGLPAVIVYVEEMTDDGFSGTVTKLVYPETFEVGMKLNVLTTEMTGFETADGKSGYFAEQEIDFSGCYVWIECSEYDPDTASIVAGYIIEVPPPDTTP